METIALYLLKSVVWISGFTLIYYLFLRNERFFLINRIFLLAGIIASFLLPMFTLSYAVDIPAPSDIQIGAPEATGVLSSHGGLIPGIGTVLIALYLIGATVVASLFAYKSRAVIRSFKKAELISDTPVKILRTSDYTTSFSFFSWVFVNPSVSDVETREIVNHEMVHISQRHWADLVLGELLCVLQWFNPLSWIYIHFIRQNHEFLADEGALQRSPDPAIYRATLLNQVMGLPLFSLSNSFNYSLTKKRFKMMKNIVTSPYRKMRVFLILPVVAAILVAFAKPEYRYTVKNDPSGSNAPASFVQDKVVKGEVLNQNGAPLSGATIVVKGTTIGTSTDPKGYFTLGKIPADGSLVVSYIGFRSKVVKPNYDGTMKITMVRDTITISDMGMATPPPPPPPPADPAKKPLVVVDGKVTNMDFSKIDQQTIKSVDVLKDESAVKAYGDKGKNGVILITLYKPGEKPKEKTEKGVYVMVEEMPQYPGGDQALMSWIGSNIKYPAEAVKKGTMGQVEVAFEVTEIGTVKDVKVTKSVSPALDAEAVRVVSAMPEWKPGRQNGKPVGVIMKVPINFKLN
jgi:TonB family protein